MVVRERKAVVLVAAGILTAVTTFAWPGPASAEDFFEQVFGGIRRAIERATTPPSRNSSFDPFAPQPQRGPNNPAVGFCVRTCDGHYFPVHAESGMSAADMCRSFCPATETRLYSGSNIDYAVTSDGSRYADLGNAYVYRQHLVAGCTCNGRSQFGLAHIDVKSDPTLRPGDVVATKNGLMAYTGGRDQGADFTPVETYSGFSKSYRDMLSAMKVSPNIPDSASDITSSITPPDKAAAQANGRQSAQQPR
jgi:hypothetical protein